MVLQQEIDAKSKEISTDGYTMSIGELMSLYQDKELDIHPEFQRFFRWTPLQKTKLIESLLLGIPIPSIFVSQREDGVWDVIDGLQRLSTIFEFVGILRKEDGSLFEPSVLQETEYLPSLEGKYWENESDEENSLTNAQRLFIKRNKIDVQIVKKESDSEIKYELFQRLNTLGSKLSDQEVRNCLMVMIDSTFFNWFKELSEYEPFLNCVSLAEKLIDEQYNQELVLRFFMLKNLSEEEIGSVKEIGDFITKKMEEFSKSPSFNREVEAKIFKDTFDLLSSVSGEDTFKRYNRAKDRFEGKFLISAFESIATGIGFNINSWNEKRNQDSTGVWKSNLIIKIKNLWLSPDFQERSGSGVHVSRRVPINVPLGKSLLSP